VILAVLDTNVFVAAIGWRGASCLYQYTT